MTATTITTTRLFKLTIVASYILSILSQIDPYEAFEEGNDRPENPNSVTQIDPNSVIIIPKPPSPFLALIARHRILSVIAIWLTSLFALRLIVLLILKCAYRFGVANEDPSDSTSLASTRRSKSSSKKSKSSSRVSSKKVANPPSSSHSISSSLNSMLSSIAESANNGLKKRRISSSVVSGTSSFSGLATVESDGYDTDESSGHHEEVYFKHEYESEMERGGGFSTRNSIAPFSRGGASTSMASSVAKETDGIASSANNSVASSFGASIFSGSSAIFGGSKGDGASVASSVFEKSSAASSRFIGALSSIRSINSRDSSHYSGLSGYLSRRHSLNSSAEGGLIHQHSYSGIKSHDIFVQHNTTSYNYHSTSPENAQKNKNFPKLHDWLEERKSPNIYASDVGSMSDVDLASGGSVSKFLQPEVRPYS